MSATPEVVSSLTVMPSSFSTRLNQASRCAFWKAPPHEETVMLCWAMLSPGPRIVKAPNSTALATTNLFMAILHPEPLRPRLIPAPRSSHYSSPTSQGNQAVGFGWPSSVRWKASICRQFDHCCGQPIDLRDPSRASSQVKERARGTTKPMALHFQRSEFDDRIASARV